MADWRMDLMMGDCLECMKEIAPGSVDMVLCDLPYGTTQNRWDSVIPLAAMWSLVWTCMKAEGAAVFTAQTPFDKVLGVSDLPNLKYEWVWQKESGSGHLNAKRAPLKNHENVLVFCRKSPVYNPQMREGVKPYTQVQGKPKSTNYGTQTGAVTVSDGTRYPLSVLDFARDKSKVHPTQKPVALMDYLIRTYTNPGEVVLDFTMGSGTTGVAAMQSGRRFIGIERDEGYFQIACDRIEKARTEADANA